MAIGSEIDLYLLNDTQRAQFAIFYAAVADYARATYRSLYPEKAPLRVTTEVRHAALLDPILSSYYLDLHSHSDTIGVSYYPLDNDQVLPPDRVATDFSDLVALYGDKPIVFFQLGYPSGYYDSAAYPELVRHEVIATIGSSDVIQAEFIEAVFSAWDTHIEHIALISFTWLNDETETNVQDIIADPAFGGGVPPSPGFVEFLRTLGLRTESGIPKPAFERLREAAAARGWEGKEATLTCI